jgi:tetratricopeptide (TPR) repeat protein
VLRQLAEAAGERDFDEVELRYWRAAAELAPDDTGSQRGLARALTRQGRFDEAVGSWHAAAALEHDAEAAQALADLRGAELDARQVESPAAESPPADVASLVRWARQRRDEADFLRSEEYLARAQSMAGGDLAILEEREETRLARSRHHLDIAKSRSLHDRHPKAQLLVERLEVEHNRLEIEILNIRAERLPEDANVRIELARRLKRASNFSGAVLRLEEALRLAPEDPAALVELGECWQHLRQFAKALGYYERAIERRAGGASLPVTPPTEHSPTATQNLARYRAAVLAAAMDQIDAARRHFDAILAVDPGYRDARERLDNLPRN